MQCHSFSFLTLLHQSTLTNTLKLSLSHEYTKMFSLSHTHTCSLSDLPLVQVSLSVFSCPSHIMFSSLHNRLSCYIYISQQYQWRMGLLDEFPFSVLQAAAADTHYCTQASLLATAEMDSYLTC